MKLNNKHERELANAITKGYRVYSRFEDIRKCFPKVKAERAYEIFNAIKGELYK